MDVETSYLISMFQRCYQWIPSWSIGKKRNKQYLVDRGAYVLFHLPDPGGMNVQDAWLLRALEYAESVASDIRRPRG